MTDQTNTPRRIPGPVNADQAKVISDGRGGMYAPAEAKSVMARQVAPMQPTTIGKIAGAIAAVMSEVGVVEKGGTLSFSGTSYKYVRMEDLLRIITPLMGRHGLAVIQNEVDRGIQGNNLAMTYEFSIFHSSGECWPERPRFTGLAAARDDKAINKAHTSARKYFLLSLFQVPTGDLDDADDGPAPKHQETQRRTVPGPTSRPAEKLDEGKPHRIILGEGTGADQWANAYMKAIKGSSRDELPVWDKLNDTALQNLSNRYSAVYGQIITAVEKRYAELGPARGDDRREMIDQDTGEVLDENMVDVERQASLQNRTAADYMPDPASDAQAAINWVAQQLTQFKTIDVAGAFWDELVVPRAREFRRQDFDLLQGEWRRCEARLAGS